MAFDLSKFATTVPSCRPRTIEVVTEEAKEAVAQIATGFMDLGDRLIEAKEMLPHGEWLPWLEREMHFSERTAQKYMAIAREYKGNPQLASDLGSEKAFALLALPKEEREQIAAEGVTVNGKTKAAADLTTREVKQIVAKRKQPGYAEQKAQEYLAQREEEEELFWGLLRRFRERFANILRLCGDRREGIDIMKLQLKYAAQHSSDGGWTGSPKGVKFYGADHVYVERTWTEIWDVMAVMALQEAGRKQPEPEGQLTIVGYMPGGTNPGRESGLCVCMMQLDPDKEPAPMLLYWDGAKCEWQFKHGAAVEQEPVGWMRLPEWRK